MKRIAVLFLCVAAAASAAEAQTKLTFGDALRRALEVNNSVESARAEIGLATATKDQLLSAVMPRITLDGSLTRNNMEQTFGEGSDAVTILPRNDWNYSIILSQPVFAGRRELRAYSQAKLGIENARESAQGAEDASLLYVASNFLGVVNADARIEVEKRNIELAEKRLTQAKAFYEAGEVTNVDVLRAQTAMKAAQRLMAAAEQMREQATTRLRESLDLDGAVDVVPPQQAVASAPDQATLEQRAVESRPDVDVAENNLRIAKLEVSKQFGYWLPTVRFEGGYVQQKVPFPAGSHAFGALRFNVPLFQSGEVTARMRGAKERQKQAEVALDAAKLAAREDVRRAFADLNTANTSLALAKEQLDAAQAEYEQSFELYRAQEATSLDLAASETSLADARRAVAEETLNRDLAELRVWYAAGSIKQAVGITQESN